MGSGETTPTMAKVHRQLFERLAPVPVPAVLLDTPYGFQSNAQDISARAIAYFRESAGTAVAVACMQRTIGVPPAALEAALARVAEARWVFSGPGSPTYALAQWRPTIVPTLLSEKISEGGCIVFSSAAALTLGRWTVPVYEIYKAGEDPVWADGLDLLGPLGSTVAVVPHFDNAEGGTHDTRYCYLGEERLRLMEAQLPPEGWVLGVDEHTVCVFDFDAGTASVSGLGAVTVRRHGTSAIIASGRTLTIDELVELAGSLPPASGGTGVASSGKPAAPEPTGRALSGRDPAGSSPAKSGRNPATPDLTEGPLLSEARRLTIVFDTAVAGGDADAATEAVLELEATLHAWSADTFQSDELDRARAALRRMVVRLGELAAPGLRDPRDVLAPWVEALLVERTEARQSGRFADGDRIRQRLEDFGVEVRDSPAGTDWGLRATAGA
jgi:cyanophycinase-like exopeptidase